LGLDLGKEAGPTALAVAERHRRPLPEGPARLESCYGVRHLQRWPLGTDYTDIVSDLAALLAQPPLAGEWPLLCVDKTGVGDAVCEMLQAARLPAALRPVVITSGQAATWGADGSAHVAKQHLVGAMHRVIQSDRYKVAPIPERALLDREMSTFQVRVSAAGRELYESWREGDHDDLVLAVAIMVWCGENWGNCQYPAVRLPSKPAYQALREKYESGRSEARRVGLFGLGRRRW
jgi:hypothetical protein